MSILTLLADLVTEEYFLLANFVGFILVGNLHPLFS